jgi:hypothetical protein
LRSQRKKFSTPGAAPISTRKAIFNIMTTENSKPNHLCGSREFQEIRPVNPRLGVQVFAANGDDLTVTDDPMKVTMRQIASAFSELEKARLVAKLKASRERRKAMAKTGKCEGRKGYAETMPGDCSARQSNCKDLGDARRARPRHWQRQATCGVGNSEDARAIGRSPPSPQPRRAPFLRPAV